MRKIAVVHKDDGYMRVVETLDKGGVRNLIKDMKLDRTQTSYIVELIESLLGCKFKPVRVVGKRGLLLTNY